jgi:hypothetical protein
MALLTVDWLPQLALPRKRLAVVGFGSAPVSAEVSLSWMVPMDSSMVIDF